MFRGTDGWDYESIADKLLEQRASTSHNSQRVINEAMNRMTAAIAMRAWSKKLWDAASRPTVFGRSLE